MIELTFRERIVRLANKVLTAYEAPPLAGNNPLLVELPKKKKNIRDDKEYGCTTLLDPKSSLDEEWGTSHGDL